MSQQEEQQPNLSKSRDLPPEELVYKHVSHYAKAYWGRAIWELVQAFTIYLILDYIQSWNLLPVMALIRMKLFIIFHDLAHMNFFPSMKANTIVGTILGSSLLMSFSAWQRDHNYHHKHSNNLDRKQYSQTAPWTVDQYNKASKPVQVAYDVIYSPLGILFVAPSLFFYVLQRFLGRWWENLISLFYFGTMGYLFGMDKVIYDLGTGFFSGLMGVFLFHVQHTFPGSQRKRSNVWSYYENGMRHSSFLQLPPILKYFTFGIEYHHIHHLNARVPGYRLQECHEAAGDLFAGVPQLDLWQSISTLNLSKYDEKTNRFV